MSGSSSITKTRAIGSSYQERGKKSRIFTGANLLYTARNSPFAHIWKRVRRPFPNSQKRVEPNSGLGQAIQYMRNHWTALTLFLRKAGAPLDNNICERALKMAILHRKNSLGYKTQNGARLGDLFMSLIHTCRLCGGNPLDYLNAIVRHAKEARDHPTRWFPWNYKQALPAAETG